MPRVPVVDHYITVLSSDCQQLLGTQLTSQLTTDLEDCHAHNSCVQLYCCAGAFCTGRCMPIRLYNCDILVYVASEDLCLLRLQNLTTRRLWCFGNDIPNGTTRFSVFAKVPGVFVPNRQQYCQKRQQCRNNIRLCRKYEILQ